MPSPPKRPSLEPPFPNLPPSKPLRTPPGQVLALGNQTLMNRAGEQGDAVPADLVAEVLSVKADGTRLRQLRGR